ncbi:uncharacterized protein [Primulina huaijiensis]|uniref:uncharacterized protein isoform X1 n=1 Tax=Primulina huaijiensis TaxID=1492673 RepID=UPI003CC718C6
MFWHMAGLSAASPCKFQVETILDKENFTLEELLDEDEIIQECKALNGRLINFLRERAQIKQLLQYIVEDAPEESEKERTLKLPFIACEIFTCEVDVILKALVEDEGLMDLLFSFLDHDRSHSTSLAGYFSKVVVCLLLRKTTHLMNYIRARQNIINKLVDLIGITSIMEVLIRLFGADEHIYTNYSDFIQWLESVNVLEMIVNKFSSSDCPEVHANAAETLCALTRFAPPGLASKIASPSFIGRLFHHALERSRPKSVLVSLLSVCISLLDPKRLASGMYYMYNHQMTHGSGISADPETVEGMLENLGDLLKLLDVSSKDDHVLLTTYGKLQPPLGKHRLKIIEFISVLVAVSSEVAEKEFIRLGAVKYIFEMFFEYPYNNFLHHYVERIVVTCLESKNPWFVEHILHDCNVIGKILEAEKNLTLAVDVNKTTIPVEGRTPPRIGNIGHLTRIANKLVQLGNNNREIQALMEENSDWIDWKTSVLLNRNAVENVFQWTCGRPNSPHDRTRDSDDDDYQDRDYDVAALANNLSQAFQYGIYSNDIDEARCSLARDDEDVYFDDESAEVVISSLRLGNDQESGSLFTNSNWFAFDDERKANESSTGSIASSTPIIEAHEVGADDDEVLVDEYEDEDYADTATSEPLVPKPVVDNTFSKLHDFEDVESSRPTRQSEWVEWRESSDSVEVPPTNSVGTSESAQCPPLPNGELQAGLEAQLDGVIPDASLSSADATVDNCKSDGGGSPDPKIDFGTNPSQSAGESGRGPCIEKVDSEAEHEVNE